MISIQFFPLILLICSLFMYAGNKYEKRLVLNIYIFISLIVFTFIFGVRVNFGTDQIVYQHMYEYQGVDLLRCEPIFVKLNQFLYKYHFSTAFYFCVLSFLEIFFFYLTVKNEKLNICISFILFYSLYIFHYVNISRQAIAMNICLCSFYYFYCKKYIKWGILIFLAGGFHIASYSLFLMTPLLYFFAHKKIPNFIFYLFLIIAFVMFERFYDLILENVFIPFHLITGAKYKFIEKFLSFKIQLGSALGVRLKILGYLCMLPFLLDDSKVSLRNRFYFLIFYFGLIGELISSVNMNLQRVFLYYTLIQIIILSKNLCNLKKNKILELKSFLFCFGMIILFFLFLLNSLKGINNTSYYTWCFDF